ncbi:MAG: response regulator transcription factor [Catonella sp.]|nr:response regulator transcription factor [Catonella sp.]
MKILLAEDEIDLQRALTAVLTHSGYQVDRASDGEEALALTKENVYDLGVFDIMMPKMDGITLVKNMRAAGDRTPVLFLTAKAEVDDRVIGLDAGADDYLTKPFAMGELLARIRSMERRFTKYNNKIVTLGTVSLDTESLELVSENSIRLATREAEIMQMFMLNPDKEFSTKEILDRFFTDEADADENAVWLYISYLRKKLVSIAADLTIEGEKGGSFKLIETEGAGEESAYA